MNKLGIFLDKVKVIDLFFSFLIGKIIIILGFLFFLIVFLF